MMVGMIWRLVWRWRWPCLVGFAVGFMLFVGLQPRPVTEFRFSAANKLLNGIGHMIRVSPSGRFVLIAAHNIGHFYLFAIDGMKLLFEHDCCNEDSCQFNEEDGLAFAAYGKTENPLDLRQSIKEIELWHWTPEHGAKNVDTRTPFHPYLPGSVDPRDNQFNGLHVLGKGYFLNWLLSPDGRTWLFPNRRVGVCDFELIDARTGQVRARLTKPSVRLDGPTYYSLECAFCNDGSRLVTYTRSLLPKAGESQLDWWDVQTGKSISSYYCAEAAVMGKVISIDRHQIYALSVVGNKPHLQSYSSNGGYQQKQIEEVPLATDKLPRVATEVAHDPGIHLEELMDIRDGHWIYFWRYELFPKQTERIRPMLRLPTAYYTVRELPGVKALHWDVMPGQPIKSKDDLISDIDVSIRTAILGKDLLSILPAEPLAGWRKDVEEWREKYCGWIPVFFNHVSLLKNIETVTGRVLLQLRLDFMALETVYHAATGSLYLLGRSETELVLQQYRYPFRAPWKLIGVWTLMGTVVLVLLQELSARRKKERLQP